MSIQDKLEEREAQLKQAEEIRKRREQEKKEHEERVKELKEKMKDPEYRAERAALMKHLHKERPKVHTELRDRGLRTYADYSFFCKELNLGWPEDTWEYRYDEFRANFSAWLSYIRNRINVWVVMLLVVLALLLMFLFAFVSEEKGRFTVNLTAEMLRQGFELSESEDFNKTKTRLFAREITNSNAVSVYEMNRGLAEADGSHNGPGYMAYTFYIKNNGDLTVDYGYTVNILSETLNTGSAAWVMFFEDDKQIIYARATEDGTPENLFGYPDPPFYDLAYNAKTQYYEDWNDPEDERLGKAWGIITTPFIDQYTALQGYVSEFGPGEVKKYTMVVWVEGDDPDCNNDLLGGHVGFNVSFDRLGEEKTSYFKGLFREEYDKAYWAEEDESVEATRPEDQPDARDPEPDETDPVHETTVHETEWYP